MAQRRRRKYGYKFTEKTQSKKGIAAFFLAVLSIAIFIYVIVNSFHHGGNGSMYLGSAGVSSMLGSTGRCGTGSDEPSGGGVF